MYHNTFLYQSMIDHDYFAPVNGASSNIILSCAGKNGKVHLTEKRYFNIIVGIS